MARILPTAGEYKLRSLQDGSDSEQEKQDDVVGGRRECSNRLQGSFFVTLMLTNSINIFLGLGLGWLLRWLTMAPQFLLSWRLQDTHLRCLCCFCYGVLGRCKQYPYFSELYLNNLNLEPNLQINIFWESSDFLVFIYLFVQCAWCLWYLDMGNFVGICIFVPLYMKN